MDNKIYLKECIGPAYYKMFWDIEDKSHIHYVMKGGRGSLKSSFAFLYIIYKMTQDALNGDITHCVGLRKIKDTIKESVFTNFLWAINMLGLNDYWNSTKTPMRIWFKDNTILFRGCANQDDYNKIKSIKFERGYCKYAVFEELTEFAGMDEILSILQSLFRGGNEAAAFYMYNPPASRKNWVNEEMDKDVESRFVHHSTYLDVPEKWLGKVFIKEAEEIKKNNNRKYRHMYLGEVLGEGLEIYPELTKDNPDGLVEYRSITDEEIQEMTKIYRGLDFGLTCSPLVA
jgi:PBSX family phage terminase large subunit